MDMQVRRADVGGDPILAVVDDDAAVRGALTFSFETKGYEVEAFADAESALRAAEGRPWRCLILDQRLPGMSGLDLLDALRSRHVNAPAVLITTHPSAATRARAAAAGVAIVEKPLLDEALSQAVKRLWSSVA